MTDRLNISNRLTRLGFPVTVLDRYCESHRHYHNLHHLQQVIANLGTNSDDDELFLAAVYHDAVYDPKGDDNEERSAALFAADAKQSALSADIVKRVKQFINDTKTHKPSSERSAVLQKADLYILDQPLSKQIEHEHQIFREYQFLDVKKYTEERIRVLEALNAEGKLDHLITYVSWRTPLIGVFCGSFNPFHKGHYNILQKAEKIFDKVIVAFGSNPEKNEKTWPRPVSLQYRQQAEYSGLLTDFVQSLGYDVVVIRGLRNSTDFQYEQNQYRYIQELMPGIKIVNIFCDKEFEHISSSGIRTLERFGKHQSYLLE
jgi:pantetheine-phosphate adenylyltransferase